LLDGPSYVGDQPYELKKQRLSPLFLLAKGKSRTMHELQPKKKMKKKGMQVYSLRDGEKLEQTVREEGEKYSFLPSHFRQRLEGHL
jgi:hypothetical protein